jgi:hypothetical protein
MEFGYLPNRNIIRCPAENTPDSRSAKCAVLPRHREVISPHPPLVLLWILETEEREDLEFLAWVPRAWYPSAPCNRVLTPWT